MRAEDEIHHAVGFFQLFRHVFLLHHAAAHGDDLVRVLLLRVVERADVAEHALLGVLTHGAGVDDHHIRLVSILREPKAHRAQVSAQFFAVGLILLAAVGVHHGERLLPARLVQRAQPVADLHLAGNLLLGNFRSLIAHIGNSSNPKVIYSIV